MATPISSKRSKRRISISSDLHQVLEPFIWVTRSFGFLPIVSKREGSEYILRFSLVCAIYSYLLAFFMTFFSLYGLHEDFHQIDSIRMKNSTVKYVTLVDLGEVIMTVFIGIMVTPFRLEHFWKLLESIQEIDKVIPQKMVQNERKQIIISTILGLCCVIFVLTYELYLWGDTSNENGLLLVFMKRYLVIFCTYFMVFVQEMPYWNCTRLVRRRIEALNYALNEGLEFYKKFKTRWVTPIKNEESKGSTITAFTPKTVLNFMKIHELIGDSVTACNDFGAISILFIMFSCLLHLVVTPYFLLVEVANNGQSIFIFLQLSWTLLHCGRLMVIVETCQRCLDEHGKTRDLVFKLLVCDISEDVEDQLKLFALQLSGKKMKFTSFSMMKINRALLTAIGGSVTTFLVILFQFGSVGSDVYYSRD